jgi:hypothetical protein
VVINKVGKILAYLREVIREFCEKNFHFEVLLRQDSFNRIVVNKHLFTTIGAVKAWH